MQAGRQAGGQGEGERDRRERGRVGRRKGKHEDEAASGKDAGGAGETAGGRYGERSTEPQRFAVQDLGFDLRGETDTRDRSGRHADRSKETRYMHTTEIER